MREQEVLPDSTIVTCPNETGQRHPALSFGVFGWLMRRKKKETEQRLHEIEERNLLTPKRVADAKAEVAADFFNSDYCVTPKAAHT